MVPAGGVAARCWSTGPDEVPSRLALAGGWRSCSPLEGLFAGGLGCIGMLLPCCAGGLANSTGASTVAVFDGPGGGDGGVLTSNEGCITSSSLLDRDDVVGAS